MTVEPSAGASRVRPRLRRVGMGALIVLLPLGAWTIWDYVEARRVARIVEEIRAKGEPVSIVHVSTSPTGAEPALRYYEAAAALIQTAGLYDSAGLFRRLDFPNGEALSDLMPDIRAWLEKNREAEDLLGRVPPLDVDASRPGPGDYSRQFDRMMRLASLADMRALERADAGDPDGAARAVLQQLQIARFLQAQPSDLGILTGGLVIGRAASAISSILEAAPSAAVLTALQDGLAHHDRDRLIEQAVLEERAFVLGLYWEPGRGWFVPSGSAPINRVSGPIWLAMRPYVMHLVVNQVHLLTAFLESSRKPWPDRLAVGHPDVGEPRPSSRSQLYFMTAGHSREATVNAHKTRTRLAGTLLGGVRSTITAIAIERYRRAHAGAFPPRLDDLVPGQLRAIPVDPFSGTALLYTVVPDGFLVYSVGTNRTDDGGQGAGTQLRRRWGANQSADNPLDVGIKVKNSGGEGSVKPAGSRPRE